MDRIVTLKGLITKFWNSGKYTSEQDFYNFFRTDFIKKYNVSGYYYADLIYHINNVCKNPPKISNTKRNKKQYEEYYVYFYIIDDIFHPVYIGKTYDIETRLNQHLDEESRYNQIQHILYCKFKTEQDALDFEAYYTRYLQPEWNISNKITPSKLYKLPSQQVFYWIAPLKMMVVYQ